MKIHKRLIDLTSPAEVVKQIVRLLPVLCACMRCWELTAIAPFRPPCQSSPESRSRSPVRPAACVRVLALRKLTPFLRSVAA